MTTPRKKNMTMVIGEFMPMGERYVGKLETLRLDAAARFIPAHSDTWDDPDFRLMSNRGQIGVAWYARITGTNCVGLSVTLDDPFFPAPLHAKLVRQDALTYVLLWSREDQ
jgi:uncharacterized protein (DUF736 family)